MQLVKNGQYTNIQLITLTYTNNTQIAESDSIGDPNLAVFIQNYVLPAGNTLTGVQVTTSNKTTFLDNYLIRPVQPPCDMV